MAIILATITSDARRYWPWFFGRKYAPGTVTDPGTPTWNPSLLSFKVGEGGWYDPGSGATTRVPDPDLRRVDTSIQDLDAVVDGTRLSGIRYSVIPATYSRAWFEKELTPSDFTYPDPLIDPLLAPNTVEIRCLLDLPDFNDDGHGNAPEIWELGIFSDHPLYARDPIAPDPSGSSGPTDAKRLMIAYGTFPKEIKYATNQIEHIVKLIF